MGALAYGAGAGKGLEDAISQMLAQQAAGRQQAALDENIRSNHADEGFRDRQLQENTALRTQAQDFAQQERAAAADRAERDDIRATVPFRTVGANVDPAVAAREIKVGGIPETAYNRTEEYQGMSGDDASEPINRSVVKWGGTAAQQEKIAADKRADAAAAGLASDRAADNARADASLAVQRGHLAISQQQEQRLRDNPMLTAIQLPDGSIQLVSRGDARGKQGPDPASQRIAGDESRDLLGQIDTLLGPEGTPTPHVPVGVGPVAGTVGKFAAKYLGPDSKIANALGAGGKEGMLDRSRIGDIRSAIGHARYGAAFTATEKAMMDDFIAAVDSDPQTAAVILGNLRASVKRRLSAIGQTNTPATPDGATPAPAPSAGGDDLVQRLNQRRQGAK